MNENKNSRGSEIHVLRTDIATLVHNRALDNTRMQNIEKDVKNINENVNNYHDSLTNLYIKVTSIDNCTNKREKDLKN